MNFDLEQLMAQAQKLQQKMEEMSSEMKDKEYIGSANNHLIEVTVTGAMETKAVKIDPPLFTPEDREAVEEMLVIAFNDAMAQINQDSEKGLSALGLPR